MATTHQLLRIAARDADADATDSALLRRYVAERDEAAFAELVRRNGPVVFRACRHVLGDATAAEDAFQATFLLLAREAARLTQPGSLAGWLHAAAVRVARGARRTDVRTRRRERAHQLPLAKPHPDDLSWREVRAILDTELAALPEKYRDPLVLCYFQELSYEDAARRIGCPVGTLRGRLERGKERLRKRLARYGLPMTAPVLIVGCPPPVSAALTEASLGAIRSAKGGAVPPALAALLPPASRFRATLVLIPAVAALVAIGVVLAASGSPTADPPKVEPPKPAVPVAEVVSQPLLDRLGDPLPPGAIARLGTRRMFGVFEPRWTAFSPDGKLVVTQNYRRVNLCDSATGRSVFERDNYYSVGRELGWRTDGCGVAIVRLPDGSFFVSEFTDPNEKLPNPPLGNDPRPRVGPDGLEFLTLSPDATRIAIVREPEAKQFTIDLLPATVGQSVAALKPIKTLGPFAGPCREIRFTPRSVLFLTGSWKEGDWTLSVVDPDKNAVTRTVAFPPPAYCVHGYTYCLSTDGRLAAIPYQPKTARNGRSINHQHDGCVHLWDLETGKEISSILFSNTGYETGLAFTRDGKSLITFGDGPYVQVWDVKTGKECLRSSLLSSGRAREAAVIAVSPDGKRFVTGRKDGRLDVWDTATAKPLLPFDTHRDKIDEVAIAPDGRLVATLDQEDTLRVWELASGRPISAVPGRRVHTNIEIGPRRRPAFTPDGRGVLFAAGEELSQVDPATGKALELPGGLRSAKIVVSGFSADRKTLVTSAGNTVTLWNWPTGTVRLVITVPLVPRKPTETAWVDSVSLCPDGRFLFTNSIRWTKPTADNSTQNNSDAPEARHDVWDARTGKHLHQLKDLELRLPPAHFSPDGRALYISGLAGSRTNPVTALDPITGKVSQRFIEPDRKGQNPPLFGWRVGTMTVSPDGRLLATAEWDWSTAGVWVYETASGRLLKQFAGQVEVKELMFSPDGRRLVSVSGDQTGLVWDVTLPALVTGRVGKPNAKDLADAWERLGGADPVPGYLGIAALVAAPTDAVALLKAKLQPAPVPTDTDIDRITTQLGADEPDDREKASAELERFGPNAVAGAKARLAQTESAEARDRLTRFLTRYNGPNPSPYELRCVRGVAALEEIGTAGAKEVLNQLARGKADDVLTREATAAHRRACNR